MYVNSSDGNKSQSPNTTEIEVSVFGPGFGESIVVHLGDGEWAIVDSCLEPANQQPAAREYLKQLGVDVATAVKLVVATHWHDDHIRGLGAILRACTSAQFFCSAALRGPEITELVELYGRQLLLDTTGVTEFAQVIDELTRRAENGRPRHFVTPEFAVANLRLWFRAGPGKVLAEIHALSPSSAAMGVAQARLSHLTQNPLPRRLPPLSPNHASVVLWIKVGGVEVLLGSDLEEQSDQRLGWSAIVNSTMRVPISAEVCKTAHHGSENGDHAGIWKVLLQPRPVTVTTPFVRGNVSLPTKAVAQRICDRSSPAYLTAFPVTKKVPRRSHAVDRTIQGAVRWIRQVQPVQGHVRLRRDINSPASQGWAEEMFGAAVRLERLTTT